MIICEGERLIDSAGGRRALSLLDVDKRLVCERICQILSMPDLATDTFLLLEKPHGVEKIPAMIPAIH